MPSLRPFAPSIPFLLCHPRATATIAWVRRARSGGHVPRTRTSPHGDDALPPAPRRGHERPRGVLPLRARRGEQRRLRWRPLPRRGQRLPLVHRERGRVRRELGGVGQRAGGGVVVVRTEVGIWILER